MKQLSAKKRKILFLTYTYELGFVEMSTRVKLEDVCERGSSNLRQSDIEGKTGNYPIYGAAGYIGNVDFFHQEKSYVAVVKDGAGIGRTTLLPAYSSVIGTMQYLLPKDNVLPEYLCYVVRHMHLEKYFSGATIPHIYFRDYKNEEFNLDDLGRQAEIINIFGRVESLIEYRKKGLQQLDDLIKARFVEIMEKSVLSNETTIDSITERVKVGFVGTCEKYYTDESGIPMLRTGNITEKGIDLSDLKYVTEEFHIKNKKSQIHFGDILIARHGLNGQANVYNGPDAQCLNAVVIVPNLKVASSVFLAGLINSPMVKKQIDRTLVGSTQHVINTKSIAGLTVRIPDMRVQQEYESFVTQVDKSKVAVQKALDETQILFDSLMQQYFG